MMPAPTRPDAVPPQWRALGHSADPFSRPPHSPSKSTIAPSRPGMHRSRDSSAETMSCAKHACSTLVPSSSVAEVCTPARTALKSRTTSASPSSASQRRPVCAVIYWNALGTSTRAPRAPHAAHGIHAEIKAEYADFVPPKHGCTLSPLSPRAPRRALTSSHRNLTAWADTGVLMLNTCLTVRGVRRVTPGPRLGGVYGVRARRGRPLRQRGA
ncbi:hypothetical protein BC834DRAFT_591460 [Gloeopeniophorella convolvens]|nr:hypothetical protein BC834DRAFT_591460 [Gloeopeniophorella convolvens]